MPLFTVATPFNIDLEFSLAAFHKRMLAWMTDLLIIFVYCYIMLFFVHHYLTGEEAGGRSYGVQSKLSLFLLIFTVAVPVMAYHLIFELLMNGRSPGKLLLGIKVMNKEGASATFSQLLLRWILCLPNYFLIIIINAQSPAALFSIVFLLGITALPDVISIAVSSRSQRLGDLAAGTVVVDTRYRMDIGETIYMEVDDGDYEPVYPQVLKLTDRDINGIRNLLSGKQTRESENYLYRVAYRIEEVLEIKMNGEPLSFLQTLLKDYNYLTQNRN